MNPIFVSRARALSLITIVGLGLFACGGGDSSSGFGEESLVQEREATEFCRRALMSVNEHELSTSFLEFGLSSTKDLLEASKRTFGPRLSNGSPVDLGKNSPMADEKKETEIDETTNFMEYSAVEYLADRPDDYARSCVFGIGTNHTAKRITVLFKGTSTTTDWKNNFDLLPRCEANPIFDEMQSTARVWVHRGFSKAILKRKDHIISWIQKYKKDHPITADYPIFVVGHSMGGAIATLFSYYACHQTDITAGKPVSCYTFGAPPAGKKNFAKVFRRLEEDGKIRLARFYNADDPVPNCLKVHGYIQNGLGIELKPGQWKTVTEDESTCSKLVIGLCRSISAHAPEANKRNLESNSTHFRASSIDEMYEKEFGISARNMTAN